MGMVRGSKMSDDGIPEWADIDPDDHGYRVDKEADPEAWEKITNGERPEFSIAGDMDAISDSVVGDAVKEAAREEQQRIEYAIRGAIRAGYDGVDINRSPRMDSFGIESITPWNRPEPDGANGYRATRYTWDYFSDDELTRLLTDEEFAASLRNDR